MRSASNVLFSVTQRCVCLGISCLILAMSTPAIAEKMSEPEMIPLRKPDPKRLAELSKMLEPTPTVPGPTIADRAVWKKVAATPPFSELISQAEALLNEPVPELPDDLFLEFSRTGRREGYERPQGLRRIRLSTLVMAECMENTGRFLPAIEEILRAICGETTWVLPAHDKWLSNFRGTRIRIDLMSSLTAWSVATAVHLLGDSLSPEVQDLAYQTVEKRAWRPLLRMVTTGEKLSWWMTNTNNWNAVCLAGVVGSALTLIESSDERALFVAGAEMYIPNFLAGFSPGGYCSEGVGYWNYGFGRFILLARVIHQATGGKVDLMADPRAKEAAQFGRRIEILPGVYPAFADSSPGCKPAQSYMDYVSRRYRLGWYQWERQSPQRYSQSLYETALQAFDISARRTPAPDAPVDDVERRSWFPQAGVLICRPAKTPDPDRAFGVACKGGHNDEHHNHNDVGSFVVAVGDATPIVDPGAEVYTARTFSDKRYDSNVLNSFGHSVPVVGGLLQPSGADAKAEVVRTEFTDDSDTLVLDLRPAYDVEGLIKLERTFVYSRLRGGSLAVTDEAAFRDPTAFETALITFGDWKRNDDGSLTITDGGRSVTVTIETTGGPIEIEAETIREEMKAKKLPTRIGLTFTKPIRHGVIRMIIKPQ